MFFFLSNWASKANTTAIDNVIGVERSLIGNILNIIRLVGTGVALIMLTYMSIAYFTANGRSIPGAIERQASIKGEQLTKFAIGAAIFIGASNIIYFVANFVEDIIIDMAK